MEKQIEKAIRETLVIENPQSIHIAVKKILILFGVNGQSEQLSCESCVFNTHSWSGDYPCATCCNFDKHKAN